ncbi:MAG: LPS assembly lipoprotein LptE [Pseudomonadota bacterium]|nr:LPS assembly lipoprotein LptE [Pseudomonadota bacterium]
MSRAFLLVGLCLLTACADMRVQTVGEVLRQQDVAINVIQSGERKGQLYSRQLRERFGSDGPMTHDLSSKLNQASSDVVSVRGTGSNLKKMTMTAEITLVDRATGEIVLEDSISSTATLGAVSSYFAQTRSDRHGSERLAMILADRVAARVQLFFLNTGS